MYKKVEKYFFTSVICLFLLGGCTSEKPNVVGDYRYFLFATPLRSHPIWLRARDGFFDACSTLDVKCDWLGPTTINTLDMQNVIETGIMQGVDAIITQGVIDPALISKAKKAGIPIVLVDSDMPNSERTAYFGKDFQQQAQLLLNDIEGHYGKDKYLQISIQVAELGFDIAQAQIAEVKEVFKNHPGGFEIVEVSESKSDMVRAKKEWSRILDEHKDVNVAINFAGESVESCYEISESMQMHKQMLIYGVDDIASTMQLLKDGKIEGSIVVPFYDYGYETAIYLNQYLDSDVENRKESILPILMQMITPENILEYEASLHE